MFPYDVFIFLLATEHIVCHVFSWFVLDFVNNVIFVAWLNLDIGIDVCFIDGLDAYIKTWLQLAFPAYIISLIVMVIIVSTLLNLQD